MIIRESKIISILNTFLLMLSISLAGLYIVWANESAADSYQTRVLGEELAKVTDENALLASLKAAAEDPIQLREFAERQNMVQAHNASYVFENGNVALRR